ncbi:MAG: major capsid protein [Wigfec virus K19_137]|nr:MAG: major capsid protein [Wigfec virus K19_137]
MAQTSAGKNLMSPQEYFSTLQKPQTPRSSFDRGCEILTTMNAGILYPIYWDEVLPADTWNVGQNLFARINTLIKPLMDNLYLDIHWFFVPNRLTWTHWVNFMGEQVDPAAPITYTVPQMTINTGGGGNTATGGDLATGLGIPYGVNNLTFSALPFRSYYKIYDDYYRDENLIATQLPLSKQGDATVIYNFADWPLLRRAKRKDYFTSALPWAQKGTAPTLTLGGTAALSPLNPLVKHAAANSSDIGVWSTVNAASKRMTASVAEVAASTTNATAGNQLFTDLTGVTADLSTSVGFTLNAFREFATIQQYLEIDARGGTRYVEHLSAHFGVQPEDSRLQRAEYLGGSTLPLMVTPVAQTSESDAGTPQANLAGMGTFAGKNHGFVKSFTEDGIIMAIASVRQEQRYQSGLHKKWSRSTRYDYYRPVFANLGEQPILNQEIYAQGTAPDTEIFGYQEAWAEYRYSQSIVTGILNSNATASLDVWHLAQDDTSLPVLNKVFIEENPPIDRVVSVVSVSEPAFTLNGRFHINNARAMPMRSTPGLTRL